MSIAAIVDELETNTGDNDDELYHLYCHDPNRGLCGTDLTDMQETEYDPTDTNMCIVCDDLDNYPCEECGE